MTLPFLAAVVRRKLSAAAAAAAAPRGFLGSAGRAPSGAPPRAAVVLASRLAAAPFSWDAHSSDVQKPAAEHAEAAVRPAPAGEGAEVESRGGAPKAGVVAKAKEATPRAVAKAKRAETVAKAKQAKAVAKVKRAKARAAAKAKQDKTRAITRAKKDKARAAAKAKAAETRLARALRRSLPKRSANPIHLFNADNYPKDSFSEGSKIVAEMWRNASQATKQAYADKARANSENYESVIASWRASLTPQERALAVSRKFQQTLPLYVARALRRTSRTPRKPRTNRFFVFMNTVRQEIAAEIKQDDPDLTGPHLQRAIIKLAGARWRALSAEQKKDYSAA